MPAPELIDPDLYARDGYPHETWTRLRNSAPAYYYEGPDYPFWALTRHVDIVHVSRNPRLFSNRRRFQIAVGADFGSDDAREPETMIHMDPPKHQQYRELLARRFTPRAMRAIEQDIAAIAWMLDLPRADWPQLYSWANAVIGATDPEYQRPGETAHETRLRASTELYAYFGELTADRAHSQRDDLVSVLSRAEINGERLATHELVSYCLLLVAAGTETTAMD